MKQITITIIILLGFISLQAQSINKAKMKIDLKIAEDIVSSLVKNESEDGHFYSANASANYIQGFGVMISIEENQHFFSRSYEDSYDIFYSGIESFKINIEGLEDLQRQAEELALEAEIIEHEKEIIEREKEMIARESEKIARETQKIVEKNKYKNKSKHSDYEDDKYTYRYSYTYEEKDGEDDENNNDDYQRKSTRNGSNPPRANPEETENMYTRVITAFFTDYADLIGQLGPEEKILITVKNSYQGNSSINKRQLNGSIIRKNLTSFKTGEISVNQFKNTMQFNSSEESNKKSTDLELLSSLLQRLYKSDLATTYYTSSTIKYERVKGFGVIYKMKVYSSTSSGANKHRIVTQGVTNLSQSERDEMVNDMYPRFVQELKENILTYGKTLKSLENDESLMFQVRLTECGSCDMPKTVTVSVKWSILADFNEGEITKDKALLAISIKETK